MVVGNVYVAHHHKRIGKMLHKARGFVWLGCLLARLFVLYRKGNLYRIEVLDFQRIVVYRARLEFVRFAGSGASRDL